MKRILSIVLAALLILPLACSVALAEEERPVLTIGDVNDRSSKRVDGENQLGMWRYLEDLLGVEVSGRTARVNLSAGFYRACQPLDAVGERSVVYAMVNTLCQLDSISAVRFYVEGMAAETLAGGIYLKSALMPNPGLVTAPEVTGEP